MTNDTDASYEGLSLIKFVLVKDSILNLIYSLFSQRPRPAEEHSDDRLAKDID